MMTRRQQAQVVVNPSVFIIISLFYSSLTFLNVLFFFQLQTSEATKRKYTDFQFELSPKHNRKLDDKAKLKRIKIEKVVRSDHFICIFSNSVPISFSFKEPHDESVTVQSIVEHKPMKYQKVMIFRSYAICTSLTLLWMTLYFRMHQTSCRLTIDQKFRKHAKLWYKLHI